MFVRLVDRKYRDRRRLIIRDWQKIRNPVRPVVFYFFVISAILVLWRLQEKVLKTSFQTKEQKQIDYLLF